MFLEMLKKRYFSQFHIFYNNSQFPALRDHTHFLHENQQNCPFSTIFHMILCFFHNHPTRFTTLAISFFFKTPLFAAFFNIFSKIHTLQVKIT